MVVMAPLAPNCPVGATAAVHPYPPTLCSLPPTLRFPPTAIFTSGWTSVQCPPPPISTTSLIRSSSTESLSADSLPPSVILTSGLVPCTAVTTNGPFSFNPALCPVVPFSPKMASSPVSSPGSTPQGAYTCPVSMPVSCSQKIINGSSVLQCSPGVCQLTPTAVLSNGAVEMCPVAPPMLPVSPTVPPICATTPWRQSYGMEQVWQSEFRKLFSQFTPHLWSLLPVVQKPTGIWSTNVDSAKVRFCCEDCGHGWTSMKGRVAFWFMLNSNGEGVVCLKLYGQQCDRCKTGNYEPAMWYPEEVLKVLVNVYNIVGQVYYGFHHAPHHRARRAGKPRTPHNSDLCQACKDGVCAERR